MKSKIRYGRFATALTAIVFILLFIGCITTVHDNSATIILLSVYVVIIVSGLFYGPAYIKADPDSITLGSLFKSNKIPMRDVESVEMLQPTMGAIRIFASGGFMGYWGIFKEGDIGRYYAFYGKPSDCFLVRLKNGDKYMLGCEKPYEMADYIKSRLK